MESSLPDHGAAIGAPHSQPGPLDWNSQPLIAVFFLTLSYPMGLPNNLKLRSLRSTESVPWSEPTEGHNFVDMTVRRAPLSQKGFFELDEIAFKVAGEILNVQEVEDAGLIPMPSSEQTGTVMEVQTPLIMPSSNSVSEAVSLAFD